MKQSDGPATQTTSDLDLRIEALAAMIEPTVALARALDLPLDDLQALTAVVYYRSYASSGLSQPAIAAKIGKSVRTVATLAAQARGATPALLASERLQRRRALMERLGRGAATFATLRRSLLRAPTRAEDAVALRAELDVLVADGVVVDTHGELSLAAARVSLVRDDAEARLDALRRFVRAVGETVQRRFFERQGDATAFARVLSFRGTPAALRALREDAYGQLRDAVVAADGAAVGSEARATTLAICIVEPVSGG